MKKSKFNIFREIRENSDENNKIIIFNSYSLAIAVADKIFFEIYDNLENIDINKLNETENKTLETMLKCNFIVSDETDEVKNLEYFKFKKITDAKTFHLYIYPTLNCNFDCYYCYEKNKKGVLSKQVQEKILELIKYHAERKSDILITWHGGEPLLAFDIIYDLSVKMKDICEKNNVNYSSIMKSNGYLFTDNIINRLKDCNINKVQIVLDGPPEMHNKRRYIKNTKGETFDKILENLKKLKMSNINIDIFTLIDKKINIDIILALVKILEKNDLIENFFIACEEDMFSIYSNENRGKNENCFTPEEYIKFAFKIYKKFHELGIKKLENIFFPSKLTENICYAANIQSVDPEGYLYKCPLDVGLHNKAVGNISDNKEFNEKFFNNNVRYLTWNPFKFDKCNNCNLLPICFGGCPRLGIQYNDPHCGIWKYVIEELIEAMVLNKIKEKK